MSGRQCDPKGNVSFPLKFGSSSVSGLPTNDPNFMMSFQSRSSSLMNPKFEDSSRTNGGLLDEPLQSLKIVYNNYNYTLVSTQVCLATHSILLGDNSDNNKIDYILTLESDKDLYNTHIAPISYIIVVIPLIKTPNDQVTVDNPYLAAISNYDISGSYNIQSIFTGLKKFIWYETCLEPHGDLALAYVSVEGLKISENLYWNLLAAWRKDSPYDLQQDTTNAVGTIKNTIKDFCANTSDTSDINLLDNSITKLQTSVYVPKLNKRIETWPHYMPPYDIVLNVAGNNVVSSSSMGSNNIEGFQTSPTITGVYVTETGGATPTVPLSFPTGTPPTEAQVVSQLQQIAANSVDGQTIDLGQFKCVPLDMDGAVDASGVHFDSMGQPLTDLYAQRNALRADAQVNKVSLDKLEIYFAFAVAGLVGLILILFVIVPWARKTMYGSVAAPAMIPSALNNTGFYVIMGLIILFGGFMLGAAATSI